jgi:hypothetical protein
LTEAAVFKKSPNLLTTIIALELRFPWNSATRTNLYLNYEYDKEITES